MSHPRRPVGGRTSVVAALVSVALLSAACGEEEADEVSYAVPFVYDLEVDPAANVAEVDPARSDVAPADAVLGLLEQGLAWHGITLVEVMRAARRGVDAQPWIDELVANTAAMTATVGLVYGPIGARSFHQQWAQHTQFLVDYAVAIGNGDDERAAEAESDLEDYTEDSGSFFSTATGGALPADAVTGLLSTHVAHMTGLVDADHVGDEQTALDLALTDNDYLFGIAAGLAGAITGQLPEVFPGTIDTPKAQYCTIGLRDRSGDIVRDLMAEAPDGADAAPTAARFDAAVTEVVAAAP